MNAVNTQPYCFRFHIPQSPIGKIIFGIRNRIELKSQFLLSASIKFINSQSLNVSAKNSDANTSAKFFTCLSGNILLVVIMSTCQLRPTSVNQKIRLLYALIGY